MSYTDLFQIDATVVANEFLDKYMPKANGDYVKVYLYLLKNRVNGIDVETIAEHLQLTEGDVRRAIRYWEEQGIVSVGETAKTGGKKTDTAAGADDAPVAAEASSGKAAANKAAAKASAKTAAGKSSAKTSSKTAAQKTAVKKTSKQGTDKK